CVRDGQYDYERWYFVVW
nr:immunoglobulin heavy chain junction region [Mus musculus]MBK4195359.1 immunoglobulin heavy chain junction region [Mus musculus]